MEQLKRWADYVCMCMHILSACLPFCQWISRSRQAEPRVFAIVCVPHLLLSLGLLLHLDLSCVAFEFMEYVISKSSPEKKNQPSTALSKINAQ